MHCSSARRGLSVLEVFGCMAALGGGILLGSLYLGVDVEAVAVRALDGEAPAADETLAADAAADEQQQADPNHDAQEVPPATDVADSDLGEAGLGTSAGSDSRDGAGDVQATDDYWKELTATIDREAANRATPPSDSEPWELFDYIARRRDAHAEAVAQLQQLEPDNVDPRLLDFADRVETWHQQGADLYARAAQLLTDSGSSNLGGPVAQSWQSAATQQRMEERLLVERRQSLQQYLSSRRAER